MSTSNPGAAVTTTVQPQAAIGNITKNLVAGASITPASVATVTTAGQSFTLTGLGVAVGDQISAVQPPAITPAGVFVVGASVTAADTVQIVWANVTAGSLTPPAGVYTFEVNRIQSLASLPTTGYLNAF
jgi:hypothetical protein